MSLTVEQILAAEDKEIRKIPCPEWGGDVYLTTLTAGEIDRWENANEKNLKDGLARASLVGLALCDESGKRLNPSHAEIVALSRKSMRVMGRLASAALSMNKLRMKDIEELEGNSNGTGEPDFG